MENIIKLVDDLGNEVEFEIVEMTTFQEKKYILIKNKLDEYLILKENKSEDSEDLFEIIDNEDEENLILEIFKELLEEE